MVIFGGSRHPVNKMVELCPLLGGPVVLRRFAHFFRQGMTHTGLADSMPAID